MSIKTSKKREASLRERAKEMNEGNLKAELARTVTIIK